ncbi:hypothetical protein [Evtepia sp.]|uniref:hypothetical protein n=1 Tax=Evtepia sp. TaxID=2773933 RepID=UPI003990AC3C
MSDIHTAHDTHREDLLQEGLTVLARYTHFSSTHRVTFSQVGDRLAAHLERVDGTPIPQSDTPLDQKLTHLKDQTVVIRPFFLPMANSPWDEEAVNTFTQVDFDYAAVLGYGVSPEGKAYLKALYFLPTDALLERQQPGEDGAYHLPLATYYVHHLSLDPRKNFARFLYLAERMTEALEYQYDKMGYFYSNP